MRAGSSHRPSGSSSASAASRSLVDQPSGVQARSPSRGMARSMGLGAIGVGSRGSEARRDRDRCGLVDGLGRGRWEGLGVDLGELGVGHHAAQELGQGNVERIGKRRQALWRHRAFALFPQAGDARVDPESARDVALGLALAPAQLTQTLREVDGNRGNPLLQVHSGGSSEGRRQSDYTPRGRLGHGLRAVSGRSAQNALSGRRRLRRRGCPRRAAAGVRTSA